MRLTGQLLKIEDYSGTSRDEKTGQPFDYSGKRLYVLDGLEMIKVKIPKDQLLTHGLVENTPVDLAITVSANAGARGAYLTNLLIGPYVSPAAPALKIASAH